MKLANYEQCKQVLWALGVGWELGVLRKTEIVTYYSVVNGIESNFLRRVVYLRNYGPNEQG